MSYIHYLILDGRVQKAHFLLQNNFFSNQDLLKQDQENNTALHWAAKLHYETLIAAMMKQLNTEQCALKNKAGLTPYDIAKAQQLSPQTLMLMNNKLMNAANNTDRQSTCHTQ